MGRLPSLCDIQDRAGVATLDEIRAMAHKADPYTLETLVARFRRAAETATLIKGIQEGQFMLTPHAFRQA